MNHETIKNALKVIFALIPIFMIYLVTVTSLKSDMFHLPSVVLNEPWFKTTLVDFYFNIFIISAWVIYRENNFLKSGLWIVAFICLGSIATAAYVLLQLMGLKAGEGLDKALLRKVDL